jgi:glutathionyl-hydroquinone reductase
MLINGNWSDENRTIMEGAFSREASQFGTIISQTTINEISRTSGRFSLFMSHSCPWCHKILLIRTLKKLEKYLPVIWFGEPRDQGYSRLLVPGADSDTPPQKTRLHHYYSHTDRHFTGRATVPLLWDNHDQKIISNKTETLLLGLDSVVNPEANFTLYPSHLKQEMLQLDQYIYEQFSNAVYRAGFAQTQDVYETAVDYVFECMAALNQRLTTNRYLWGDLLTNSDLQLFTTLIRFDAVYAPHFRCTRYRLTDFKHLWDYARHLFALPGVSNSFDFQKNQEGYFLNDGDHNPHGIVGELPKINWAQNSCRQGLENTFVWQNEGFSAPLSEFVGGQDER